jgi:hypothetical protein
MCEFLFRLQRLMQIPKVHGEPVLADCDAEGGQWNRGVRNRQRRVKLRDVIRVKRYRRRYWP